jgi:protein SCO1/2
VTVQGGTSSSGYSGVVLDKPFAKPSQALQDTAGKPFDIAKDTNGKITIVYFGYTHCPDVCPLTMSDLSQALERVPAKVRHNVEVVFVTTDPARDTGPVMRAWLDRFDPSFVGLTGPMATIKAAATSLGVAILEKDKLPGGGYDVDHGAQVIVFGKDGQGRLLWLAGTSVDDYVHDLTRIAKA